MKRLVNQLEKLRRWRVPMEVQTIRGEVERSVRAAADARARGTDAARAWADVAPEAIRGKASPGVVRRGVLNLVVDSPVWRRRVDDWLRGGGEREIVSRLAGRVARVKVVLRAGESPKEEA